MIKDEKIQYKRYNVNQNYFYALREVDKSNIPAVFEEFEMVSIFLLPLAFSIDEGSSLVKTWFLRALFLRACYIHAIITVAQIL